MKKYILLTFVLSSFNLLSQDYSYSELLNLGYDCVYEKNDYKNANNYFTQAIKMYPDSPYAYFGRGMSYRLGLDFEAENLDSVYNCIQLALNDQSKALDLSPKKDLEFKGDIWSEIGILQLLNDDGDYCSSWKKSCKYENLSSCESYESLCK